jgi:hypothetical protein
MTADRPFDIEIGAAASARRIRFERAPNTDVEFEGCPDEGSRSETTRENLPEPVERRTTYRDVRVRWRARARVVEPDIDERPRKES